jgi:hypothetical protein
MPLSDDEQRRLDEIEHSLLHGDRKFAARATHEGRRGRRMLLAGAVLLSGAVLVS